MANIRITGLRELEKKLLQIDRDIATKIADSSTLAGINVLKGELIQNTPTSSKGTTGNKRFESRNHSAGNLKKTVIQKKMRTKSRNFFGRVVGYKSGGGGNGDGWYGNFIEYNTRNRGRKSSRIAQKPMSRSFDAKKMDVFNKTVQTLEIKLRKILS
jgi:HK97 gp10 family phage protein